MAQRLMKAKALRCMAAAAAMLAFVSLASSLTPTRLQSRFTVTRPISVHEGLAGTAQRRTTTTGLAGNHAAALKIQRDSAIRKYADASFGIAPLRSPDRDRTIARLIAGEEFSLTPSLNHKPLQHWLLDAPKIQLDTKFLVKLEPPVKPRKTAAEMSAAIQASPRAVLADMHPGAAEVSQRYGFDDAAVKKSLVALAQSLKAGVRFDEPDTPKTFPQLVQQVRAADDIREAMAAVTEAEISSAAHTADLNRGSRFVFNWSNADLLTTRDMPGIAHGGLEAQLPTLADRLDSRPSSMRSFFDTKDDATWARDRNAALSGIESRLRQGLSNLRAGNQAALGSGVWGTFVKGSHGQVRLSSLRFTSDGGALVKLASADFVDITAEVPVRKIASKLLQLGYETPEVAALMPRN